VPEVSVCLSGQQTAVLSRSSCCRTTRRIRRDAGHLAVIALYNVVIIGLVTVRVLVFRYLQHVIFVCVVRDSSKWLSRQGIVANGSVSRG
jgi:hypothetical protein